MNSKSYPIECPITYCSNSIFFFFQKPNANENYFSDFSKLLKNAFKSYKDFIERIKNDKTGIIIIYNKKEKRVVFNLLKDIKADSFSYELFSDTSVYPCEKDSPEGEEFVKYMNITKFPTFLFCKFKNHKTLYITSTIEGNSGLNKEKVNEGILKASELKPSKSNNNRDNYYNINAPRSNNNSSKKSNDYNNSNYYNNSNSYNNNSNNSSSRKINRKSSKSNYLNEFIDDYQFDDDFFEPQNFYPEQRNFYPEQSSKSSNKNSYKISDGEVIAQQKYEMEQLERENEEKKKMEEAMQKIAKMEEEEKIKKRCLEEAARKKLAETLPPEPGEEENNISTIMFRLPNGNIKSRRFYLNTKIQLLYDFITSLGKDIFIDGEDSQFSIVQTFPFKEFKDKNKSIQEEGLFPNVVVQVKEF